MAGPTLERDAIRSIRPLRSITLSVLLGCVGVMAVACSSDEPPTGLGSARAVIDAHIARAGSFDLRGDCELRAPERIESMARLDGADPDSYCEEATREPQRAADDTVRDQARRLYADASIEEQDSGDDLVVFEVLSADGTYREIVEVIRHDGRWYLESVESDGPMEPDPGG